MSAEPNKPKLILTGDNYEKVRKLAERGELTELKDWIKSALDPDSDHAWSAYNSLVGVSHASGEAGIIRSRPVIKAAQNGHYPVVEYFMTEYSDIVEYESECSNDATTALHLAAENGYVEVLKLLIGPSSEVNCRNTSTGETPLHSAVFGGREDAIRYLISCQLEADVNAADTTGRTPLHVVLLRYTCERNYVWLCRVVEMLLKSGASVDQADHDGRTAFHNIAQLDKNTSQQLLKLLLNSNPELAWKVLQTPSKGQRYTELPAMLYAAEWRNTDFVDFITSQPECSPTIAADALLALSTYQNTHYVISELWERAFNKHGWRPSDEYLPSDYGNRLEICNLEEAHKLIIATDSTGSTDLHYQFLIMRERIFGFGSRATIQYLWELGHDLCKKNCFVEAEQLYSKALKMMVLNSTGEYSQPGCYIRIAQLNTMLHAQYTFDKLVSHMLNNGYKPDLFQLISYGLELTKRITKHLAATRYLCTTTHLVFSLLGVWAYDEWKTTKGCLTNEIEKLGREMVDHFSFLLLLSYCYGCTSEPLYIPPEEHDRYISFMADKIFQWETDSMAINAMDVYGYRPLHAAIYQSIEHVRTKCIHKTGVKRIRFISLLVKNGAHLDAVDFNGRAPYQMYYLNLNPKIKAIVTPPKPLPLTCIASRAIVAGGIPYNELTYIPSRVKAFVALHDRNTKQCDFVHSILHV